MDNNQPTPSSATSKNPANKNLIIIIIAVVIVAIIAIVGIVFAINSGKDDNSDNQDQTSQESGDSSSSSNQPAEKKTLSISNLSMQYPAEGWEIDTEDMDDDTVAIDNGEDCYVMLAHTSGTESLTTEEFATASADVYSDQMGMEVREDLKAQTINGKEWYSITVYGSDVWLKLLFFAEDDDYYIVTYGSDSNSKLNTQEAKDMINSLTIK